MPGSAKNRLKACAAAYLQRINCGPGPIRITLECNGEEHTVHVSVWPSGDEIVEARVLPAAPAELPAGARWLSPLERRIVAGLSGGAWIVTANLAEKIGEEPNSDFRCVLRNLGERCLVELNQRLGVRLCSTIQQQSASDC